MSGFWIILIFIKATAGPLRAAVADTGRAVTSGAAKRNILRTVRRTLAVVNTFSVIVTFQRQIALMGKGSMQFNFLTDGGLILA